MPSPNKTPVRKCKASIKKQKCGACGVEGHDPRNCPASPGAAQCMAARKQVVKADGVAEAPQEPPLVASVVQDASILDWDKFLYVVFDLETTGRSRQQHKNIELTVQILDPNGIPLEEATFSELVKPSRPIPPFITELTTITNDNVCTAQSFPEVAGNFFEFMRRYFAGQPPTVSHHALADVKATISVLFHQIFWETRSKFIFTFGRPEEEEADAVVPAAQQQPSLLEDSSHTSVSSQDSATTVDDNTRETTDDEDNAGPAGDKWEEDSQFHPSCPLPSQLFDEHFTLSGRTSRRQ
jgi:Exonuclease